MHKPTNNCEPKERCKSHIAIVSHKELAQAKQSMRAIKCVHKPVVSCEPSLPRPPHKIIHQIPSSTFPTPHDSAPSRKYNGKEA